MGGKETSDARIRKTSVLLPTSGGGGGELKGSGLSIPGMGGKDNNRNELATDNYKRYAGMGPATTVGGSVHGYKRSHSLLAESQGGDKARLPRTGKIAGDSSHMVGVLGSQGQKQKNGYQKLTNQTATGLISSDDTSSEEDITPKSTGVYRTTSFRTKY